MNLRRLVADLVADHSTRRVSLGCCCSDSRHWPRPDSVADIPPSWVFPIWGRTQRRQPTRGERGAGGRSHRTAHSLATAHTGHHFPLCTQGEPFLNMRLCVPSEIELKTGHRFLCIATRGRRRLDTLCCKSIARSRARVMSRHRLIRTPVGRFLGLRSIYCRLDTVLSSQVCSSVYSQLCTL